MYIDCDLLVVRDLSVVLDLDFGECPIGGVRDFIFDDISAPAAAAARRAVLSMGPERRVFSSRRLRYRLASLLRLGRGEEGACFWDEAL